MPSIVVSGHGSTLLHCDYLNGVLPGRDERAARTREQRGCTVDDPAQCASVLRQAFAAPGPALVNAIVDPHEPPMPPKVTLQQAAHFAEALARGTPHRGKIALTALGNRVRELI